MESPTSAAKDKNYNLVSVVQASLHYAWQMETYIADAEREGDEELARWFRKIQENNVKAGHQGKHMLAKRLADEETSALGQTTPDPGRITDPSKIGLSPGP